MRGKGKRGGRGDGVGRPSSKGTGRLPMLKEECRLETFLIRLSNNSLLPCSGSSATGVPGVGG